MNYVDTIDVEKAINTAIRSMLNELDPYTEYMPLKEQEDFKSMTTGEYGGIGSYIRYTPKGTIIAGPGRRDRRPRRPGSARATS